MKQKFNMNNTIHAMKNGAFIFLIFTGLLLNNHVYAQVDATKQQNESESTEDGVILNFQNTDILALIDLVSEVTGKNFIVDPRVKAKITIYSGSKLDESQIYEVFLSVLDVHNLSAINVGGVTKIIPIAGSKQAPLRTSSDRNSESGVNDNDNLVTQVYKLEYASAADILPVIRPLIPAESHVAVHPRSGTLVFTDTEANVKRVLDIISYLDVADTSFNIRIIPLKYAIAKDLKEAISTLISDVVSREGQSAEGATKNRKATVYAETSSNSIIVNGSDEAYAIILSLVESLDVERPKTRDLNVIKLKYANAADMSAILNEVAQKLSPSGSAESNGVQPVSVQVHEPSNTLVIFANKPDFLAMKSVIDQLDIRRKQVYIEAIIAEVSFNNAADLGVEWTGNVDTRGGGAVGTNFSDISGGFQLGVVNNLVLNQLGAAVPDLSLVLSALRSDSSANILSTPNLLTVDNEKAEIVVGQEVPFITGQFTTGNDQTTTNADGTTTTVNPFQTIERKDIGLKLTVTPRINTGGLVTMVVEQEISNVSSINIQGASDLVTDERRITATVQALSGKIVVIGGLIRDDVFKTDERVPFLGDIPILGNLFKRRSDRKVKTNLMVFLRAKIIDDNQPIADETVEKYNYIRDLNLKEGERKDDLVNGKELRFMPPIYSLDSENKSKELSISNSSDSELIEMIWRYALPENILNTGSSF